jgi:putative phosphoserine phosphatase/1-acylglycerol-3-phosphate O-acyltransferase
MGALRAQGHRLVLATTSPYDFVAPLAEALGLDDVIATRYEVDDDGVYTGRLEGGFVWGLGKLAAVKRWIEADGTPLEDCHAFSDSVFDVPLLSSVGYPHPVNPDIRLLAVAKLRGWEVEQWDRPDGVASLFGLETYDLLRHVVRPELFPYARFELAGLEHIPPTGPVLLASNHRSYFDVVALALVAARLGRPVRAMAKAELFDAPVVATVARALGGIRVEREGDTSTAYAEALSALKAGEVVIILPQGTIPRGEAFFDTTLRAKTGVARLAHESGAPVVPIALWGTEHVWPRSARVPNVTSLLHPPKITVTVGGALTTLKGDLEQDTRRVMDAISELLPEAAQMQGAPSQEQLAKTYPSGTQEEAT